MVTAGGGPLANPAAADSNQAAHFGQCLASPFVDGFVSLASALGDTALVLTLSAGLLGYIRGLPSSLEVVSLIRLACGVRRFSALHSKPRCRTFESFGEAVRYPVVVASELYSDRCWFAS